MSLAMDEYYDYQKKIIWFFVAGVFSLIFPSPWSLCRGLMVRTRERSELMQNKRTDKKYLVDVGARTCDIVRDTRP